MRSAKSELEELGSDVCVSLAPSGGAEASKAKKVFALERERLRQRLRCQRMQHRQLKAPAPAVQSAVASGAELRATRLGELQRRAAELQQGVQLSERVPWPLRLFL